MWMIFNKRILTTIVLAAVTLSSATFTTFSGVVNYMPRSTLLKGWTICFEDMYDSSGANFTDIYKNCASLGNQIMMGCYPYSEPNNISVAAMAPINIVFTPTGPTSDTNYVVANKVEWYLSLDGSWGFAPENASLARFACDLSNVLSNQRVCWHMGSAMSIPSGEVAAGYRCGNAESLQSVPPYPLYMRFLAVTTVSTSPSKSPSTSPTTSPISSPSASPSISPSISPSMVQKVEPCVPLDGLNKKQCNERIRICGHKGIKMKWNSKGCVVPQETSKHKKQHHQRAKDSGCQCDGYCGYSCEPACSNDPQCVWQNSKCYNRVTGQPGINMPFCPRPV